MKRAVALLVATCLVTQPLLAFADKPAPTEAQKAEARARYDRGLKLYDQGAFEAALVEMKRAYELAPAFKILYNLGLIYRQLNDHAAALDAFNQYLAEGGKKIDAKRHAEIEHHLADLKPLVATLTIQVDASGAEVTIDDAAVGTSPLATPITVNAGKRKISAKLPGKSAVTKVITVAGSDTVTVKLEVAEPTKAPPVASGGEDKPKETPKPADPGKPIPWVAWGITGVFAASAATMGILTLGAASDLDSKRATANVSRDDLDSASSRTKTFALVTDILLVGTIAAAGVATYLTIKAPKSNDTASTTVQIGVSPTGLAIVGAF